MAGTLFLVMTLNDASNSSLIFWVLASCSVMLWIWRTEKPVEFVEDWSQVARVGFVHRVMFHPLFRVQKVFHDGSPVTTILWQRHFIVQLLNLFGDVFKPTARHSIDPGRAMRL